MTALDIEINWRHLIVDFEKAIHKAVNKELPFMTIKGCRFHLAKAWFKKILKSSLQKIYFNKESSASTWLKYLFAFPGIDADNIFECFREYVKSAPAIEGISDLVVNLEKITLHQMQGIHLTCGQIRFHRINDQQRMHVKAFTGISVTISQIHIRIFLFSWKTWLTTQSWQNSNQHCSSLWNWSIRRPRRIR